MNGLNAGGDPRPFFSDLLPDGFIPHILELVMGVWEDMKKPPRDALEPRMTALLTDALIAEIEESDLPFLVFQERPITDPDSGKQVARTDLEFYHRDLRIRNQQPYFTFESKRLNIPGSRGRKSNASAYVGKDGMMCFVTGKYSQGGSFCGMLGYVLDGDVTAAYRAIKDAIKKNAGDLRLASPRGLMPSNLMPAHPYNGETHHQRNGRPLAIFHLLLSFSRVDSATLQTSLPTTHTFTAPPN
jgi:hypothetical protein